MLTSFQGRVGIRSGFSSPGVLSRGLVTLRQVWQLLTDRVMSDDIRGQ